MTMLIFKLREVQAKYDISGKDLANYIGVVPSVISDWRSGKKSPSLNRLDEILNAVSELGDKERLKLYPLSLSELIEWRPDESS